MGNLLPITYGGHILALLFVPSSTSQQNKLPHSILGHYLAPTNPRTELQIHRETIRNSRNFETEIVTFRQNETKTAVFIIDRQMKAKSELEYGVAPTQKYTLPDKIKPVA